MTHISNLQPNTLIAASAPPTKAPPPSIEALAAWLKLETFGDPELEDMVRHCGSYTHRMKEAITAGDRARSGDKVVILPSWLSLYGKSGTGKTHCATRVWDWAALRFDFFQSEFAHKIIYWPAFIDELRDLDHAPRALYRDLQTWPVLFLDDIGAERDRTGFAAEKLNTLMGARVGRWTIITSNLTLEQLGGIDPRIADRIIREPGNLYLELTTDSYAIRKRLQTH